MKTFKCVTCFWGCGSAFLFSMLSPSAGLGANIGEGSIKGFMPQTWVTLVIPASHHETALNAPSAISHVNKKFKKSNRISGHAPATEMCLAYIINWWGIFPTTVVALPVHTNALSTGAMVELDIKRTTSVWRPWIIYAINAVIKI